MNTDDLTETDRHGGDSDNILGRDEMVRENWAEGSHQGKRPDVITDNYVGRR